MQQVQAAGAAGARASSQQARWRRGRTHAGTLHGRSRCVAVEQGGKQVTAEGKGGTPPTHPPPPPSNPAQPYPGTETSAHIELMPWAALILQTEEPFVPKSLLDITAKGTGLDRMEFHLEDSKNGRMTR